jgi:hypothetical protein
MPHGKTHSNFHCDMKILFEFTKVLGRKRERERERDKLSRGEGFCILSPREPDHFLSPVRSSNLNGHVLPTIFK